MRSSVSPVPSCPCLLAPNASSVPPTVTAMLWSPPAAMAVTRAGGLSLVGSSDWMAWGTGMAMGCGLGACTGGRWRGQARGRGANAGFGQRLREKAASRKCARPSQSSWWQLSKPGATSGHNCACRKALSITNHPQPPRMHTCTSATSCWWPSCPNLASPHVKILPSAASAIECARPAAADTMRSPLQPGATRGACEERKLFERRWGGHRKKRAGDGSSSRYFSGLCGCSRPATCSAALCRPAASTPPPNKASHARRPAPPSTPDGLHQREHALVVEVAVPQLAVPPAAAGPELPRLADGQRVVGARAHADHPRAHERGDHLGHRHLDGRPPAVAQLA